MQLLDILPLSPSSLPNHVRAVWSGAPSETAERYQLKHLFTVSTERARAALYWLKRNHRDYHSVTIDDVELNGWQPLFVTEDLLDSIGHVSGSTAEDAARAGFGGTSDDLDHEHHMFTVSGIADVNCVSVPVNAMTLERLAALTDNHTIHMGNGNCIRRDHDEPSYFISAFLISIRN